MVLGLFGPTIRIGRYYCLDCGFTEEWVDDLDDIRNMK